MLKNYEAIFILRPTMTDAEREKILSKIEDLIKKNGGEIKQAKDWGKRELAYRIKKFNEAVYHEIEFIGNSLSIQELKKQYNLLEDILKFMIFAK